MPFRRRSAAVGREDLAAALLEELNQPLIACDPEGRLVVVNRRARTLHGAGTGELTPERWREACDVYHPGTKHPIRDDELPLWRALAGEDVEGFALDVQPRGGPRRRLRADGRRVTGRDGRPLGAVVVLREVDQPAEPDTETRLQTAMLASTSDSIALVRAADGELVYVNAAWERLFGYGPGELAGAHVSAVLGAGDHQPAQRAEEILGALERTGRWQGEVENIHKDGTRFWCEATLTRYEHPDHGAVWITVQSDITERKVAELALVAAEERFRTVFEESPVGIAIVDDGERMLDVNAAFGAITGHGREVLVGMTLDDITHPDDRELDRELAARVARGELRRYRMVKRFVTRRGTSIHVALTSTVVRDPGGRTLYRLVIAEDPAARRAAADVG
jgi:PAS domain S-box-containing protein